MEKLSNSEILNFNFTKKARGKFLANLTNQALKNLGKNYKLPKGYKTEFIEFSKESTVNVFGDEKTKKIYFSFDILLDKENFAKDVYNVTKEVRRLCTYKGKYDENNNIDRDSKIFTSTQDLTKMITIEKSGNAGKDINAINTENSQLVNQIEKDVEFYMMGKNFLSPKEKQSRKFAMDLLKEMLSSLSVDPNSDNIRDLMDSIKRLIDEKEKEEEEKEKNYTSFIQNVERSIMDTMKVSQERLADEVNSFAGLDRQVENYKTMYGYDPVKTSLQTLGVVYNEKLARNLFNACVGMDKNKNMYLNTCLDLIKYTDFKPTQPQIHQLNTASKAHNATCQDNKDKIYPKKDLKDFFNIKTQKKGKENVDGYEHSQQSSF